MSNYDSSSIDYIYTPGGIDSTDDDIKHIKISDDPVRNCYYKTQHGEYIKFPSDPNNFNTEPNDYFASPRGPLFFDFINLVGERINGPDGGIYNYYNVAENEVPVRNLHATMLHQLGLDHSRLTFPFQGLDNKLTGVEPTKIVKDIIS